MIEQKNLQALCFPQKKEENKKPIHETPIVKITDEAYKKINLYSRMVSEIAGEDIECGGRMLNYRGKNDGIIRDVYLQYQTVSSGDGYLGNNSKVDLDYTQQKGMSWSGMWHSHGFHNPFHSGSDDNHIKGLHDTNKIQKACMLKSDPKPHCQRKTIIGNKLILGYDDQPLSFEINFDNNGAAKAAASNIELHDEVFYTPSIVINRDEYLQNSLGKKYYAEFLVGNGKDPDVKVKNAKLEIIEENNNILPTLEKMVIEVGEKVKYSGRKLKDFTNYNSILEKYKKIDETKYTYKKSKPVEQIVNIKEKPEEKPDLTSIVQEQNGSVNQEVEHNQELYKTKTYMKRFEEFYNSLNSRNDSTDKTLAELCRTYSGKRYRFWKDRFEKGDEILKELKKKYLTTEQKNALENIKKIIGSNKYLKRRHSAMYHDLQKRLDSNSQRVYHNPAFLRDNLKPKTENYNRLEDKVQTTNNPTNISNTSTRPKKTFGSYLKSIAKYVGIAALTTAMVILPAKYCSKIYYGNKPSVVYTVKKGDNLWNLSKDCLKKNGVKIDNNTVYKTVDKVAEENGKGKQAEYRIGGKEKKNPHFIKPGERIVFSKKVLGQEGKK